MHTNIAFALLLLCDALIVVIVLVALINCCTYDAADIYFTKISSRSAAATTATTAATIMRLCEILWSFASLALN